MAYRGQKVLAIRNWSYRGLWTTSAGCWGQYLSPLQKTEELLTTGPSLPPQFLKNTPLNKILTVSYLFKTLTEDNFMRSYMWKHGDASIPLF